MAVDGGLKAVKLDKKKPLIIVGPTAVGKSSFVYNNLNGYSIHVISADSMQVYRGFDVATASPPAGVLAEIKHSGVNELDPAENFDVAAFLKLAEEAVEAAVKSARLPVLVGGTAMYIQKYLYGLDEMPAANPEYRARLRERAQEAGSRVLHQELLEIDPQAAENIHPNDLRRIIRALEIYHETGRTKTELISGEKQFRNGLNPLLVYLKRPREELYRRIRRRAEQMFEEGLVEEVEQLQQRKDLNRNIKQAIGFTEGLRCLQGELTREEAIDNITRRTKKFARKQIRWFDQMPTDISGHPETDSEELIRVIEQKYELQ